MFSTENRIIIVSEKLKSNLFFCKQILLTMSLKELKRFTFMKALKMLGKSCTRVLFKRETQMR